jgi:hypothetical protein
MAVSVTIVGLGVAAIGLLGVLTPARLVGLLARWPALTRWPVTLGLRLAVGVLFLYAASHCRLPQLVRAVGILELAGAALLLAAGPEPLQRFVAWWLDRSTVFVRAWCSAAFAVGILLAYAGG